MGIKDYDKFSEMLAEAVSYAIDKDVPPMLMIGLIEAVKIDLVVELRTNLNPGQAKPKNN